MTPPRGPALYTGAVVLMLLIGIWFIPSLSPANNPGPTGYRIAARYFSSSQGSIGAGLNLLLTPMPSSRSWGLVKRQVAKGADVVLPVTPSILKVLGVSGHQEAVRGHALAEWPDAATAGVTRIPLAAGAGCLQGSHLAPIVGTSTCVVLSRLPVGRGTVWLLADPTFFANESIAQPGHLQILANLVKMNHGGLRFADWPPVAGPLSPPKTKDAAKMLWDLAPALVLLLWALAARFGPVRRPPMSSKPAFEATTALAGLMRRHQTGRLALEALLRRNGGSLDPQTVDMMERRLAAGPIGTRELADLYAKNFPGGSRPNEKREESQN